MDDGLELAAVEPAHQIAGRHEVGDLALAEVAPFGRVAERVVDGNVGAPGLVQAGDQIGTDEAGSARDQQHRSPAATYCLPFALGSLARATSSPEKRKMACGRPLARRAHWTGNSWQATGLSAQLPYAEQAALSFSHK